jgi:hypothetical protein
VNTCLSSFVALAPRQSTSKAPLRASKQCLPPSLGSLNRHNCACNLACSHCNRLSRFASTDQAHRDWVASSARLSMTGRPDKSGPQHTPQEASGRRVAHLALLLAAQNFKSLSATEWIDVLDSKPHILEMNGDSSAQMCIA